MFKLELKKLIRNKNGIIALTTFIFICTIMLIIKPPLENVDFFKVFNYRIGHSLTILSMIIIIAVLLCNIYSDEVVYSMDTLILSSKNKYKCLNTKAMLTFFVPIVSYLSFVVIVFIMTLIQYGKPINGSLQALKILDNFIMLKGSVSINQYIICKMLFILLVLISIAVVASLTSFKTDNSMASISIFGSYIISGKVIIMLAKPISKVIANLGGTWALMALNYGNYPDLILSINEISGMYLGEAIIFGTSIDIFTIISITLVLITIAATLYMVLSFKKISCKK